MEEMLSTYANITFADTKQVDLDLFIYLAEYDAYYLCHGDTHLCFVTVDSGKKLEDGMICLQYTNADNEKRYEVTLKAHETGYYFVSNLSIE